MTQGMSYSDDVVDAIFDAWKEIGKHSELRITGNSMHPFCKEGDRVVIDHSSLPDRSGVLAAYRLGERIVVHRVLRAYTDGTRRWYAFKGDGNRYVDPLVRDRDIIGTVITLHRSGSGAIDLRNPYWKLLGRVSTASVLWSRHVPALMHRQVWLKRTGRAVYRFLCLG